jgi:tetratricopeptide (TPR) repeat protein
LCQPPAIPGLTEPLLSLDEEEWNLVVSGLELAGLVETAPWEPKRVKGFGEEKAKKWMEILARFNQAYPLGEPEDFTPPQKCPAGGALDAHPLLREYFAKRLREAEAKAWQEGHRRLYEHLKESVPYWPEGADVLQPLYQAVAHGCLAGMHQQACDDVYHARILRGREAYSTEKLGLFGSDLGAVACFFEQPWSRPAPALTEADQAWLLSVAAFDLRALGRLSEALEPMRAGLQNYTLQQKWQHAAITANNLSELELTLGDVPGAVREGAQSVDYADRSEDAFQRMGNRTTHADVLHQAGQRAEALALFRAAETMQVGWQPDYPLLYSLQGFRYCDLLLAETERAAWRVMLTPSPLMGEGGGEGVTVCREVEQRAVQTLKIAENHHWLLNIALDHLTLGRAVLYRAILEQSPLATCRSLLDQTVDGLRASGEQIWITAGLLTRAWLRLVQGNADGARADLDEAQQIAERGAMKLHMADIHLHRARLFRDRAELAKARQLIEHCGYGRRREELEDALEAAKHWPAKSGGAMFWTLAIFQ